MGDYFQTIVDLDVTAAEATRFAGRALDWLVEEGIVRREPTARVLGAPSGNPPGAQWAKAVAEPHWVPTDGLEIQVGRTVFDGGQGDTQYALCPRCAGQTRFYTEDGRPISDARAPFDDAIDIWYATGAAYVTCPSCTQTSSLNAWQWAEGYFAFGYLGLKFWNWPLLDPRFTTDIARVLDGHRMVRVAGKL